MPKKKKSRRASILRKKRRTVQRRRGRTARKKAYRVLKRRRPVRARKRALRKRPRRIFASARLPYRDMPIFESLTGSLVRARLIRLLFREPQIAFSFKDIGDRIDVPFAAVKKEAAYLEGLGVLRGRSGKRGRIQASTTFPFATELRTLAIQPFPISRSELVKTLSSVGKLRLVVVSGVFLNAPAKSRVDLFVVANRLSEKRLERAAKKVEAAVGAELRWAGMETKEFLYRWKMFDRFVRDALAYPHEKIVEKIKL